MHAIWMYSLRPGEGTCPLSRWPLVAQTRGDWGTLRGVCAARGDSICTDQHEAISGMIIGVPVRCLEDTRDGRRTH